MKNDEKIYPGLRKSILLLVLFLLIYYLISSFAFFIIAVIENFNLEAIGETFEMSMIEELIMEYHVQIGIISLIVPTIIIGGIILHKRETTFWQILCQNRDRLKFKLLLILAVTTLLFIFFSSLTTSFIMIIFDLSESFAQQAEEMGDIARGFSGFLLVLIAAPLAEEFIFMGLFLEGIASKHSAKVSIFATALMFSIYHLNPLQMLHTFVLGLFLAYLYLKTRSLLLCIYVHFFNNLIPFLISQLELPEGYAQEAETALSITFTDIIAYVLIIGLLIICLKYLKNYFNNIDINMNENREIDDAGNSIRS
ncbi:MAG: CPBP family intramembrane glutamic endopeptidase [bacterium]